MPFCDDEMAMITAIHDDPKNDVRRLAYADWLAAHGHEDLAELIGLTCREPYFDLVLSRTTPWRSKLDVGFMDIEEAEPERIRRSIELLDGIYGSERLPGCDFYEYNRRGLPICEITTERYPDLLHSDEMEAMPLTRFRLSLHAKRLAEWLDHPFMHRVDVLRYYPEYDWGAEEMRGITDDDMRSLLATRLPERLEEVRLCGRLDCGPNLVIELRKRVGVNLSY